VGLCLSFALALTLATPAQAGGVYVAGQGFSLEQAVQQALREQADDESFWIVAAGQAARRVTQGEDAAALALVQQVRERGGLVYVCGRDAPPAMDEPLPPGVGVVGRARDGQAPIRPPEESEAQTVPESVRQTRLILRACGALQ